MAIHIARREFIGTLGGFGCHRSSDRCPLTRRLREGSRLTLRASHTTITRAVWVVARSFPDTAEGGRGPASSLPSSVQHP